MNPFRGTIKIKVWDISTQTELVAEDGTDPREFLTAAINALKEELDELENCPVHGGN